MLAVIGVLIVFIAGLLLWENFSAPKAPVSQPNANGGNEAAPKSSVETGVQQTKNLIEETKKLANSNDPNKAAKVIMVVRDDGSSGQAVVVAQNSNPISVDTGEVLTRDGSAVAKAGTRAGDSDAIVQSGAIDPAKLPASAIKLEVSPSAIVPAEFSVSPGQAVSLAVTAIGTLEVFRFAGSDLSAVAAGIPAVGTVVLTFNAPMKLGEYIYFSDYLDYRARGAVGKMIVK